MTSSLDPYQEEEAALRRTGRGTSTGGLLAGCAVLIWAASAAGHAAGAGDDGTAPDRVAWEQIRPFLSARLAVTPDGSSGWILSVETEAAGIAPSGDHHEELASATLLAARDDLAWIVGEVAGRSLQPGPGPARPTPLPPEVLGALFDNPAFSDPLRRFADATLRARGAVCRDCLAAVRPSRGVQWKSIREYLGAFMFVREVGEAGMIDLRIGRGQNGLPPLQECDQDLAASIFAVIQALIRDVPAFPSAVQAALNEELLSLEDSAPESVRANLNRAVPEKVISDPDVMRAVLDLLPDFLERHGLRCLDCPRPRLGR